MNAVALLLCSMIAGADTRETISNTPTLHALLDRIYQLHSSDSISVQDAGAVLKVTLMDSSPNQYVDYMAAGCRVVFLEGEYQLRVVPIVGAPNCLVAGYVKQGEARPDVKVVCSVYIDVEKNLVFSLEEHSIEAKKLLTQADDPAAITNLKAALEQMAAAFDDEPSAAIGGDAYLLFQNQFFSPPAITTTGTARIEKLQDRMAELNLQFTAEGRSAYAARQVLIKSLLESNLAIPADEYFGTQVAPTAEKE